MYGVAIETDEVARVRLHQGVDGVVDAISCLQQPPTIIAEGMEVLRGQLQQVEDLTF